MWEAMLLVVLSNAGWWRWSPKGSSLTGFSLTGFSLTGFSLTGFPLAGAVLGAFWALGGLPASVYSYETTCAEFAYDVATLFLTVDAVQTLVHWLSHTHLRHTPLGRAHAVHHRHTYPTPADAFDTGALDAVAQLLLPLVLCVHVVRPSRGSLIAFGSLFSNWLHFLHSDPSVDRSRLRSFGLVTPAHHHEHHQAPWRNFSTVLAVC